MTFHIGYHSYQDFAGVTVTGGYTDAGYSVARVLERHRHTRWLGTVPDGQWQKLRFDLGSAGPETFENIASSIGTGPITFSNVPVPVGSQSEGRNALPNTVTVTCHSASHPDIVATDDGAGNLTGTDCSGTIDYLGGFFTFSTPLSVTNPWLDIEFRYDRFGRPTYLAVVDGFRAGPASPLTVLSLASYTASDWSSGIWGLSVEPLWSAGVLFSLFDPPAARRYWEVAWPTGSGERTQGASVVLLGKVLTLSEGMAAGFDMGRRKLVTSQKRDRAGNFLPAVIEGVDQDLKLKLPSAGLAYQDLAFSSSRGLFQTPSIDRMLRSYWSRGIPMALQWKSFDLADEMSFWARGKPSVAAPFISPIRRGLTLEFDVQAERHAEEDA